MYGMILFFMLQFYYYINIYQLKNDSKNIICELLNFIENDQPRRGSIN